MKSRWLTARIAVLAVAAAFATMTAGAVAQDQVAPANAPRPDLAKPGLTQPNLSTNGPAGTAVQTQTTKTVDSAGNEIDTSRSFKKTQSYSSGGGKLSAHTHIKTKGPVTAVKPPTYSQEIPQ